MCLQGLAKETGIMRCLKKLKGVKKLDKKEIEFEFERATKNTYRFQEKASGNPAIGTLYVQKSVFGDKEPKKVKVTVEWE